MQNIAVIVGLGNIGKEYSNTRHNIGFRVIDSFIQACERDMLYSVQQLSIKKIPGDLWKVTSPNTTIIICKPATYMNLSGDCVAPLLSYYSLSSTSLLVIHDELDIPLGQYRIKYGGGDAGHNGLRSISNRIGTQNYTRLRIGIGRPAHVNYKISDWVLGELTEEEDITITHLEETFIKILHAFIEGGFNKAKYEVQKK